MRAWKKALLCALAAVLFWCALLAAFLMHWDSLMVRAMRVKYNLQGYEQGGVVLAGSSTVQKWKTAGADLAPAAAVNVGISGSVVRDWEQWTDALIQPFSPKAVVLYVGANDIHALQKTPAAVARELELLFAHMHRAAPEATIYYMSVYTTKAQAVLRGDDEELGRLIAELAQNTAYLRYIDCVTAFADSEADLFEPDGVHLNQAGYVLWSGILRGALAADGHLDGR
jgi:lysophospholipase L1-like esterase